MIKKDLVVGHYYFMPKGITIQGYRLLGFVGTKVIRFQALERGKIKRIKESELGMVFNTYEDCLESMICSLELTLKRMKTVLLRARVNTAADKLLGYDYNTGISKRSRLLVL